MIARPSFRSVIWRNPPEAIFSTLCTVTLLLIGYAVGDLNHYTAYLAGFAGQSLISSLEARKGQCG